MPVHLFPLATWELVPPCPPSPGPPVAVHWAPSLAAAQLVGFPRTRARVRSGLKREMISKKRWEEEGNQGHHNHLEPVLDKDELSSKTYFNKCHADILILQ